MTNTYTYEGATTILATVDSLVQERATAEGVSAFCERMGWHKQNILESAVLLLAMGSLPSEVLTHLNDRYAVR